MDERTNNNNKRKKDLNSSSDISTSSSPNVDYTKKTKMSHEETSVPPIIVFKSSTVFFKGPLEIKKEIDSKNLAKHVKEAKVNRYGHLLIFPKTMISAEAIMQCEALFNNARKKNLANEEKKFIIVIKGLSYDDAYDNMEELEKQGIKALIEIKNKDSLNKVPIRIVKAEVEDEDTRDQLLSQGIQIGYMYFKTEINKISPKQCFKCKKFGQIAADCIDNEICDKCSEDKHEGECEGEIKCVNCKEEHSAFDRRCRAYQNAKKITVEPTFDQNRNNNLFSRNYSNTVTQESKLDQILK